MLPEYGVHDLHLSLGYLVDWIRQVNVAEICCGSSRSIRWRVHAGISH